MPHEFDPGYGAEPFRSLVADFPGSNVYPSDSFRTEWGPVFHRGRLDGSARLLIIGQDPAQHEEIAHRILVGEAGRRIQSFLKKLGIEKSYTFLNAFLYSAYGQGGAEKHKKDAAIIAYRNKWIKAVLDTQKIEAVVALGDLAEDAWQRWKATGGAGPAEVKIWHPTRPDSSTRGKGQAAFKAAIKEMLANWNAGLKAIKPSILHPDTNIPLSLYGDDFAPNDRGPLPERDFPPGAPQWMIDDDGWAARGLPTPPKKPPTDAQKKQQKRAIIVIKVPAEYMPPA
jgi:hypothetical protein